MINTRTLSNNPGVKAGPHFDADGRKHPPDGTFYERLNRGIYGDPPEPWGEKTQERFVATLIECPVFRQAVRGVLNGE